MLKGGPSNGLGASWCQSGNVGVWRPYPLARDAGFEFVDHFPEAVDLPAFDDFEGRQAVEGGVGLLEPGVDGPGFDDPGQGTAQGLQVAGGGVGLVSFGGRTCQPGTPDSRR